MSVIYRVFPKVPAQGAFPTRAVAPGSPFKGLPGPRAATIAVQGAAPAATEAAAGGLLFPNVRRVIFCFLFCSGKTQRHCPSTRAGDAGASSG